METCHLRGPYYPKKVGARPHSCISKGKKEQKYHVAEVNYNSFYECLARLSILNKILKCPLTWFTSPFSNYLTFEDIDFVKRARYVAECMVIECESTLLFHL